MTTVITRLFANEKSAAAVLSRMRMKRFPRDAVRVITAADGAVADKLKRAGVMDDTADAYADRVADGGGAVLVVRATYKPLGAARMAREMLGQVETLDMGNHAEENIVKDPPQKAQSILTDHPRFLTLPPERGEPSVGPISRGFGIPLLTGHRKGRSVISGGKYMSQMFSRKPLLKQRKSADSAISGGRYMSRYFWPMPLVTTKKRSNSVIRGGSLPFSQLFGLRTVVEK